MTQGMNKTIIASMTVGMNKTTSSFTSFARKIIYTNQRTLNAKSKCIDLQNNPSPHRREGSRSRSNSSIAMMSRRSSQVNHVRCCNMSSSFLTSSFQRPWRSFHISSPIMHRSSTHTEHRNCWNCGRDTSPTTELFFCDCGVVQKPASELSYFELMQFEPSFDIDTKKLGEAFRDTQKRLHPDMFSTKSKEELEFAQQQSSLLNKAYSTLQKPLSRALYLLKLKGVQIDESDSFSDPEFLMEVMQINEQISKAKNVSEVEELEEENDKRIESCVTEISELFEKGGLDDVKNTAIKLRYYSTIQERINELRRNNMN